MFYSLQDITSIPVPLSLALKSQALFMLLVNLFEELVHDFI